jgi:hypothetical protein
MAKIATIIAESSKAAENRPKRKRSTTPTEPKPRKRDHPPPKIGTSRAIIKVSVWDRTNEKFWKIRGLVDTGSV